MPYRFVYLVLACVALAAVALGVAFGRSGDPQPLPYPIETITPTPNATVLRQSYVEVDLDSGYRGDLYINGFLVPPSELIYIEATGVHRWQPGPTSVIMTEWVPGEQKAMIAWDTVTGLPSPGEFVWTFRVQ